MRKVELQEVTLDYIRESEDQWMSVRRAASYEGISLGRMYQFIWQGRRKAVRFEGITLVVPAPRRRKKNNVGRPRLSSA